MVLRYLLRNWLQQAAREKVLDAVNEAARREFSQAKAGAESQRSSGPRPCPVGVVFALSIESGGFEDLLSGVISTRGHGFTAKEGDLEKVPAVLFEAGAGLEAAARATEALIAGHRPRWVISAGFAGGLAPQLKRHDIVVADSVVDEKGNRSAVDLQLSRAWLAQLPGLHVGPVLTVDRVVHLPAQKRSLGKMSQALAVDRESLAVARVCRQRQVRFLAVRVVTDPVDEQLPRDVETLVRQKTTFSRLGAAFGAALQRPGSVKDMYQLRENSLVASDRLGRFLVVAIPQLAAQPPEGTDKAAG